MALAPRGARPRGSGSPGERESDAAHRSRGAAAERDPRLPQPRIQAASILAADLATGEHARGDPVRGARSHPRGACARGVPRGRAEAGDPAGLAAVKLPVAGYLLPRTWQPV